MIDWPADREVPRPYVGAVLLVDHGNHGPYPMVVTSVDDEDAVSGFTFRESLTAPLPEYNVAPDYGGDPVFYPRWLWPPEQLDIFRRLYRAAEDRGMQLDLDRIIRVERG